MASMDFSWSDSLQAAFASCLPCLKHPNPDGSSDSESDHQRTRAPNAFAHAVPPPRARPDELEGLLADASDDADALSLHTNPGERRRKKRRRAPKHIRVFGYDLFGRPPAIQLPESDDEHAGPAWRGPGARGNDGVRPRTISSSSMDSDAAPLDVAAIEQMSAARNAEALAREEEERRAKEERRRRRRERKELKRAAMARALEVHANGDQDFEGFQGSGPVYEQPLTSPFAPSLTSGTGSGSGFSHSSQEFGPFAHGQPVQPFDPEAAEAAEAEADGADFGAESYTSRPRRNTQSKSGSGTMSNSDTRSSSSRGTGSAGYTFVQAGPGPGPAPYNHQFLAQQPMPRSPLSPHSDSAPPSPMSPSAASASEQGERKKRRKAKDKTKTASLSVSNSNNSNSSATESSLTLMSPPPAAHAPIPTIVAPSPAGDGDEDFEGFPGDFGSTDFRAAAVAAAGGPLADLGGDAHEHGAGDGGEQPRKTVYLPVTGFPSVGLRGTERRNSDMGVFLARRGDE